MKLEMQKIEYQKILKMNKLILLTVFTLCFINYKATPNFLPNMPINSNCIYDLRESETDVAKLVSDIEAKNYA